MPTLIFKAFKAIVSSIFIVLLAALVSAYGAFVFGRVWDWFFVPEGFETLSFSLRIGVFLLLGLLSAGLVTVITFNGSKDDSMSPGVLVTAMTLVMLGGYTSTWIVAWLWTLLL